MAGSGQARGGRRRFAQIVVLEELRTGRRSEGGAPILRHVALIAARYLAPAVGSEVRERNRRWRSGIAALRAHLRLRSPQRPRSAQFPPVRGKPLGKLDHSLERDVGRCGRPSENHVRTSSGRSTGDVSPKDRSAQSRSATGTWSHLGQRWSRCRGNGSRLTHEGCDRKLVTGSAVGGGVRGDHRPLRVGGQ